MPNSHMLKVLYKDWQATASPAPGNTAHVIGVRPDAPGVDATVEVAP